MDEPTKLGELDDKGLPAQEESQTQEGRPGRLLVFGGGLLLLCVLFILSAVLFTNDPSDATQADPSQQLAAQAPAPKPEAEPQPAGTPPPSEVSDEAPEVSDEVSDEAPEVSDEVPGVSDEVAGGAHVGDRTLHNYVEVLQMNRSKFVARCKQEGGTVGKEEQLTFCYFDDDADVGASFEGTASTTVVRWDDKGYAVVLMGAMRDRFGDEDTSRPAKQCTNHLWARDYLYGVMTCPDNSLFVVGKR